MSREYIKHQLEQAEEKRRLAAEEEAKKEAIKEAKKEAKRLRQKQILEAQETERLRQKNIQEKEKLAEQKWDAQVDNLLAQIKKDLAQEEGNKLEEIRIIIQNRDPSLQELGWVSWLSDPLNQRLTELDLEQAIEIFKRDNLLAKRRKRTKGHPKKLTHKLAFSGDRAGAADSYATTTFNPDTYSLWNGFTISFWVRPDERMNQTSVILGSKSTAPESRFKFGIHSNGNINVGIGGTNVTGINNPMEVGQWYNWVLTYTGDDKGVDERKVRMWINNDPRMTNNTNTRWANQDSGLPIYFGGRNTNGSYTQGFACALTNVAIYNVCKDSDGTFANEVYKNGISHNYTGADDLVGYWRFSEGRGTTIADTSGNGNHGAFGAIAGDTTAYPIWVTN